MKSKIIIHNTDRNYLCMSSPISFLYYLRLNWKPLDIRMKYFLTEFYFVYEDFNFHVLVNRNAIHQITSALQKKKQFAEFPPLHCSFFCLILEVRLQSPYVTDELKLEYKPYTVKIIRAKSKMPSHRPLVSRIIWYTHTMKKKSKMTSTKKKRNICTNNISVFLVT